MRNTPAHWVPMTSAAERLTTSLADRYRIERELGQGGMATVYLAEDLRHHRKVAVKVIHPELAAVLGADRFLSEIHVTATLQHPHILPLFDSGQADGQLYYVMPFVDGESLRGRLNRERQLPVDVAVRLASEVADALDYAHRHGVIHRDIKPENILLHDGRALVADFGIALAVTSAGGGRLTQTGLSLGTPQYMSPEQAAGEREMDARSDVYSLAAVTYEMLTGEPPHTGNTVQAIIARVLTEKPRSVHSVRPSVPEHVAFAVEHALEKIPADRWSTAHEFADALQNQGGSSATARGMSQAVTAGTQTGGRWRARIRDPITLGLAAATIAAVAFGLWERSSAGRPTHQSVVRFPLTLPAGTTFAPGTQVSFALSASGEVIAFVGRGKLGMNQLFVRGLNDLNVRALAGTETVSALFFSPDAKWIGFIAGDGKLKKAAVDGGGVLPITDVPGIYGGASWSPSGDIVISMGNGLLSVVSDNGGPARRLCRDAVKSGIIYEVSPLVLADGETVLYSSWSSQSAGSARLSTGSLSTGKCKVMDINGMHPLGVVDGILSYVTAGGAVMAAHFDIAGSRVTDTPVTFFTDVEVNQTTGAAQASLSRTGSLIYASGSLPVQLVLADSRGGSRPVLQDVRSYAYPRFSPDGRKIAVSITSASERDVWVLDVPSGTLTRLTTDGKVNDRPEWTPDGKRVLYRTARDTRAALWWRTADLSEPGRPLLANPHADFYEGVITPDGKNIVYQLDTAGADIMYRGLEGDTTPKPVATTAFIESMPRVSPDGRWVAYVTTESGASQVVVQPFPGPGPRTQISNDGGREPVWAPDGRRLYYRDNQHLVAATVSTNPSFSVTSREALFDDSFVRGSLPHADYDVSPDGKNFLMLKPTGETQVTVVYNWLDEVGAQMRGKQR